jgi:Sulfotransferase family
VELSATSSAAPAPPRTRVPDFFIVGTPKTGTTALYKMLRARPQIYLPKLKEPRFLATDMQPRTRHARGRAELGYPQTLEEYLALFDNARPEQRVGEASTFYLWSNTAADAIADLCPDARIVAILREPASFLRSLHLMFLQWGVESEKDLRKAMSLEAARREGKHIPRHSHRPQLLQYSQHVRYVAQLARYRARFPSEQMLVLIYEDFQSENDATVRSVMRFIGGDDGSPIDVMNVNMTKAIVRSHRAKEMMRSVVKGRGPIARSTKATLKAITTPSARAKIERQLVRGHLPPPDESFTIELRRRFKPEVNALSEYLDRDLVSLWGYEQID